MTTIQSEGAVDGTGKPEKLKDNLAGFYSWRMDTEHRLLLQGK